MIGPAKRAISPLLRQSAILSASFLFAAAPVLAAEPQNAEPLPSQVFGTPAPEPSSAISRSNSSPSTYLDSKVVLRLAERRVYLYSGEMLVSSYPVAVGTDETPTPLGEFSVGQMIENPAWQSPWTGEVHEPGPDSALGVRWIGFADSEEGAFGFHGTPTIESIGTAASNGCVRMRNDDVVALFAAVDVGTPVVVEP